MFKIICVTNRHLCEGDFINRISEIYKNGASVILREKDLDENGYTVLARQVLRLCPEIVLHTFISAAISLDAKKIHLPFHLMNKDIKNHFETVGVSVHSTGEAIMAQSYGADYIIAGHIFATDCKKGLLPRGLEYLEDIKNSVKIPVYAIGGINEENIALVVQAGADGAAIMSGFMQCKDVGKYMENISKFT